jgi:hypothetical protein
MGDYELIFLTRRRSLIAIVSALDIATFLVVSLARSLNKLPIIRTNNWQLLSLFCTNIVFKLSKRVDIQYETKRNYI